MNQKIPDYQNFFFSRTERVILPVRSCERTEYYCFVNLTWINYSPKHFSMSHICFALLILETHSKKKKKMKNEGVLYEKKNTLEKQRGGGYLDALPSTFKFLVTKSLK